MGAGESVACNWGATCAGRVRRRALANSIRRPPGAPRTVPGTVDGRISACSDGGDGYDRSMICESEKYAIVRACQPGRTRRRRNM